MSLFDGDNRDEYIRFLEESITGGAGEGSVEKFKDPLVYTAPAAKRVVGYRGEGNIETMYDDPQLDSVYEKIMGQKRQTPAEASPIDQLEAKYSDDIEENAAAGLAGYESFPMGKDDDDEELEESEFDAFESNAINRLIREMDNIEDEEDDEEGEEEEDDDEEAGAVDAAEEDEDDDDDEEDLGEFDEDDEEGEDLDESFAGGGNVTDYDAGRSFVPGHFNDGEEDIDEYDEDYEAGGEDDEEDFEEDDEEF